MAVKIPIYTPQVGTPSGRVAGAQGRGLQSFGVDFSGFSGLAESLARQREEADANNARAELSAEEPKAQLAFAAAFDQIQRDWTPGAPPIPEQMTQVITDYQIEAEKRFTNPRTRELMTERANEFKTAYGLKGFAFQQQAEVDHRVGTYESTYQNIANLSATDPSAFAPGLAELNATVMADSQIPAAAKRIFIEKQSKAAAAQVAKAQAELNPRATLAVSNALLGVTEPVLTMTGASSGNLVADIVKRESGGRMFDAAGKLLRGPQIIGKNGKPYFAYGKYQLLDDTAQATAKELGIPWKPEVFYRDKSGDVRLDAETEQYHDLLGKTYIDMQNAEFGGNPVLVAAAHNMGPAATRGWAAGQPYQTQSGKWWYPRQPMDLAAMPEETRKYIAGLGTLREAAVSADTGSEEALAFRLLDTEDLLAVRSAAQSVLAAQQRERDSQIAINRDLFKSRVTDLEVAAKHGDPIQIPPDAELLAYLGPAQAALTKQRLMGYQQMAGALKRVPGLSNAELSALSNAPDPEGAEDRENRQFVRDTMAKEAATQLAARQADPGRAALEASPQVRTAFGAYQGAAQAFYEAGKNATPEQLAAMNVAQSAYFKTSFAQQRQWGIVEPKLPLEVANGIADGFKHQMNAGDVGQAAARMQNLPKELGSYDAMQQVGAKTGDLGWFAMEGVSAPVLTQMHSAMLVKPEDLAKQLPSGTKKADVDSAVAKAFAPLSRTFALPDIDGAGDNVTSNRYLNGGKALAMQNLVSGRASNAVEAAEMAYQDLYTDRETVVDTYRVPNTVDANAVQTGLARRLALLEPSGMFLATALPGLSEDETRTGIVRNVQRNGRWITNEDGTGVYLMVGGKPALNAEGQPIQVAFQEAIRTQMPAWAAERNKVVMDAMRASLRGTR